MAKIDIFFDQLMAKDGSDLHLEEGQKPKIRQHGSLVDLEADVLTKEFMNDILGEITTQDNYTRYQNTGDLDFAYAYGDKARFRANYFHHFHGLGAIFRIIPSSIKSLTDLNMPDTLKQFADYRAGLVLITGPTGSGKSTTLAAIIDHINATTQRRILTIEEPVEFMHPHKKSLISHREVGLDTQSFTAGLRGAIKSDADIILVGEMRDPETIELALAAAEMGILVFGTLHTNSAAKTVDRIIDAFPTDKKNKIRNILANTLKAVISQQLVKNMDGTGRHAAFEILLETSALKAIIASGDTIRITSEIQMNRQKGLILMDDCLAQLVQERKISKEEAHLKAIEKERFE